MALKRVTVELLVSCCSGRAVARMSRQQAYVERRQHAGLSFVVELVDVVGEGQPLVGQIIFDEQKVVWSSWCASATLTIICSADA